MERKFCRSSLAATAWLNDCCSLSKLLLFLLTAVHWIDFCGSLIELLLLRGFHFPHRNLIGCKRILLLYLPCALLLLYLHGDGALGVALVRQHEAEGAARLSSLLRKQWDPPDEEAGRGEDSLLRALLQLEEERRTLRVWCGKLEDEILPGKCPQVALWSVEGRRLVDWREESTSELIPRALQGTTLAPVFPPSYLLLNLELHVFVFWWQTPLPVLK